MAGPLGAGISVTHREASPGVIFVTGHEKDGGAERIDWGVLARSGLTLVVYMGVANAGRIRERLLAGGLVGIVGYGLIGQAVAARLAALGIRHRIYDPWLDQSGITNAAGLEQILDCDVVTLHPELTTAQPWPSYHLLGTAQLQRLRADALLINASRGAVVDNAAAVKGGGLLCYAADIADEFRRAATYIDRILRGTKPSDLPVQLPVKFEMAINVKTAKALGLAVPQSILLRADEVIE